MASRNQVLSWRVAEWSHGPDTGLRAGLPEAFCQNPKLGQDMATALVHPECFPHSHGEEWLALPRDSQPRQLQSCHVSGSLLPRPSLAISCLSLPHASPDGGEHVSNALVHSSWLTCVAPWERPP